MLKVRQIALAARNLESARTDVFELLGIESAYIDLEVGVFGLHNSLMVIGNSFLEIVSPTVEGTTTGRLLERRGGDGGYMVITQVGDLDTVMERVNGLGIRNIWESDFPGEARAVHLHPKDVPGAICSFDEMMPPESWKWAGPNWEDRRAKYVSDIVGVELQSEDPASMAEIWSKVFDRPLDVQGEAIVMPVDDGEIRFVKATDGRGEGLGGVTLSTKHWNEIAAIAEKRELTVTNRMIMICGTRFTFKDCE
ncbi:hypothetical protein NBRC116188_22020 [Oceaniserpentilla sp. 4NH20-0058]|uniref:VOC family protein n=1 Tax=Oceaniserpentilla sp. 4NH20-0058 TaxID=3127660 RepID=UPI00310789F9